VYAGGHSEKGIGNWLEKRENRDKVVIISKGCHPAAGKPRVTAHDLTADLFDCLNRLKSKYVDAYLLHRDDPETEVGAMVEAFNEHLVKRRIRAFGVSNWTYQRIQEANEYADKNGLVGFTLSSPNYGLAEQVEDPWGPGCVTISGPKNKKARKWYLKNEMPVLAYSSLARGFFSGRITRENFEESKEMLDKACQTAYCHEVNFQRLDRAWKLAKENDITIPQLVLTYLLSSSLQVFPIVGAANGDEFKENLKAFEIKLTPEEREWLDLERDKKPKTNK
jgi:aryl-alcohol dehydrogenase-like predicted oxidoreductase